ncbi:MAG TPA: undecaprenyl-diphosphatase UppP [Anaerolineaceae bacterium]|nr:undecaprenyl-diphosphatase UppP [Anaerolineaceae bacterium]
MTIFYGLILGIIEGLTEFIPVSSTAHMLIAQRLLGIPSDNGVFAFLVLVQLGPLLALIVYFWKDYWSLIKAFFARPFSTADNRMAWYVIIATIPAGIAGLLLKDVVQNMFSNPLLEAAIRLFTAAVLLALAEWLGKRSRNLDSITWLDALVIGLFQVLAVFPGSSRSGSTIPGGMLRNFNRPSATRFAFLMAAPIMLLAGGYESLSVLKLHILHSIIGPLVVGFIFAAIIGWLSIRWLINYVSKHSLYVFSIYCAIVAAFCVIFLFV